MFYQKLCNRLYRMLYTSFSILLGVYIRLMPCFVLFLAACTEKPKEIEITQAVMNALPPGQQLGAVYLKIQNPFPETQALNYVHSDVAEYIEVHRHIYDNGMMQMRQVKHLMVDANSELLFKPGGYHLMLFGISEPLAVGDEFTVWFEFNGQPPLETIVSVKAP